MSFAEDISPRWKKRSLIDVSTSEVYANTHIKKGFGPVSIVEPRSPQMPPKSTYSQSVINALFLGVLWLIISGAISLAGVVFENDTMSFLGALVLPLGLLYLYIWMSRAEHERK